MLKRMIGLLAVVILCMVPAFAVGQDLNLNQNQDEDLGWFGKNNWYMAISGGAGFPTNSRMETFDSTTFPKNRVSFNIGPEANLAVGRYLGHYRIEAELGYRRNALSDAAFPGLPVSADANGSLDSLSLMGNGYLDISVNRTVQLYIGAGIGAAREHMDSTIHVHTVNNYHTSGSDLVFAFQAMTGVTFRIAQGVHLNVGYRY